MGLSIQLHTFIHHDLSWRVGSGGYEYFDSTLMELSTFSENIVTVTFERSGETVELKVNIDAIVPNYHGQLEERLKPMSTRHRALVEKFVQVQAEVARVKDETERNRKAKRPKPVKPIDPSLPSVLSMEREMQEIQRESHAERLSCPVELPDGSFTALLKGWSITENGLALEPTKENLMRLPPKAVEEIWERCIERANTVKKREDEEAEETSESMPSGSRVPLALAPTG